MRPQSQCADAPPPTVYAQQSVVRDQAAHHDDVLPSAAGAAPSSVSPCSGMGGATLEELEQSSPSSSRSRSENCLLLRMGYNDGSPMSTAGPLSKESSRDAPSRFVPSRV
eukprot:2023072-Prymnesium_polylepis.1